MVAVDIYLNETTCHADLILPSTVQLEHDNYDFLFEGTAVRNFSRYSPACFEGEETLRPHWQILCELGARINGVGWEVVDDMMIGGMLAMMVGPGTACPEVTPEQAREKLGDERGPMRMIDAMVRLGPYGDRFDDASDGLNLPKLRAAEHGVDLGSLQPRLPDALKTPDKRIVLAPEYVVADLPRLAAGLTERNDEERIVLVGRRQIRNMNSWLHNLPVLAKGKERCTLVRESEGCRASRPRRSRPGARALARGRGGSRMPGDRRDDARCRQPAAPASGTGWPARACRWRARSSREHARTS